MNDAEFLKLSNLVEHLSSENSHIFRQPAVGISIAAGCVKSGMEMIELMQSDLAKTKIPAFAELMGGDEGKAFQDALQSLNTGGQSAAPPKDKVFEAVPVIAQFLKEHKDDLEKSLGKMAILSSRLYLLTMSLLETTTAFGNLKTWCKKVPDDGAERSPLDAWKARPKALDKLAAVVHHEFREKARRAKEWSGRSNAAKHLFADDDGDDDDGDKKHKSESSSDEHDKKKKEVGKKRKRASSSSAAASDSSDVKTKKNKKNKKVSKKDMKKGKAKVTKSSSSSSESDKKARKSKDEKTRAKEEKKKRRSPSASSEENEKKAAKKSTRIELRVRRGVKTNEKGDLVFTDSDPVDIVEVEKQTKVVEAVTQLLESLRLDSKAVLDDCNVRLVTFATKDSLNVFHTADVAADATAQDVQAGDVVLVRKGG